MSKLGKCYYLNELLEIFLVVPVQGSTLACRVRH